MLNLSDLINIDTKHWWVQIETSVKVRAWQQAQCHSNPVACYNAYLNQICLHYCRQWLDDWLQDERSPFNISVISSQDCLATFWEVLNGTEIRVGSTRIVLVPSETIDSEELRVPQEWVDIQDWAADYYLAVSLNLDSDEDESWLGILGFVTHRKLKNQGAYNASSRTYSLALEELNENLTVLLATLGLHSQVEAAPLATLSEVEAQKLLQIVGDASVYEPRLLLDIPFTQWAALIHNEQWRRSLYNRRVTASETVTNLSQWFQNIFDTGWECLQELLNTAQFENLAFSTRSFSNSQEVSASGVKLIDLGIQLGEEAVALLISLSQGMEDKISVIVQLHPNSNKKYLPPNLKLMLVKSGKTLQEVQSRGSDCYIQLNRFKALSGTKFSIKLTMGDRCITEDFCL